MSDVQALLILPRLRVQNANAISSPLTWGFPSMAAFTGFMHALERRLPESLDINFEAVGVVCHRFEPQISNDYVRRFHLTRNPVDRGGKTAAIVEEGRTHLEVTLIFDVTGNTAVEATNELRAAAAREVAQITHGMRLAGGSILPPLNRQRSENPRIVLLDDDLEERRRQFRRLCRSWIPGFTLVARDDLLHSRLTALRAEAPDATLLDAWLDLSALHHEPPESDDGASKRAEWTTYRTAPGWTVPIPVGYAALTDADEPPGSVANARDTTTPFRFVESAYSIGQWISPHRLQRAEQLLWYVDSRPDEGLYRVQNDYAA